ncbi:phage minor capsid protein [Ruminococcus callidus]|uniref:phage minor capsid protein n=1 Tax=Ruminococcus callidus TaxID=40519 RepID=UPI0023F40DD8|nr:phage minor capsid protein [Ruminococcus callidus]
MRSYEPNTDRIVSLYQQLEDDIITAMIRRIMRMGKVSDTTKYQAEILQQAGLLYTDIVQIIANRTDACSAAVKALFEDAGVETVDIENDIHETADQLPVNIRQSSPMRRVLEAGYRKTQKTLYNLVSTTADTTQTAFYNACDRSYMQVSSGAFSYQEAIRTAVRSLADTGAYVTYPTGHRDRIDVAVRRCTLTGVGQTSVAVSKTYAEESGCHLMELTAHSGARPEHARWQGQLVTLTGEDAGETIDGLHVYTLHEIGYGDGRGFKGWNCRHDWHAYYKGISKPNYTPEQIAKLNEKNISYNSKKYTEYEISQMQRAGERNVRALKRRTLAAQTAVENAPDEETRVALQADYEANAVKLKDAEKTLKDFCHQTGRRNDTFRSQVNGFGRSASQKAVHAAKRQQTASQTTENGTSGHAVEVTPSTPKDNGGTGKAYQAEKIGGKTLTSGADGGIIKEQERMQSSSDYAVSKDLVKSREFRSKFDFMDSDKKIQRQYYQVAKKMLSHRSGTNGEDLYFYNTRTKKWYSSTTGTQAGTPDYTEEIRRALQESEKGEIVSFHNHPLGMPPSAGDLNAALKNGYQKGYTIGHDGTIFEYTAPIFIIDEAVYNKRISLHAEKGDSEFQAQVNALLDLQEFYKFKFKEMKSDG